MLRRFVSENRKDWPQWVPFLLFAIREVPQASTGFSPFELLYGRHPRGVLDVLQEDWVQPGEGAEALASYMETLRKKLHETAQLATAELVKVPGAQKWCYDAKVQPQAFEKGQKVLLLLPLSHSKLMIQWQGPY